MVGDQIYADELNRNVPILRADTYAEFQQRYVEAYEAPNLRQLLRMAPTYMILDDHEIEDNWSQDRAQRSTSSAHLFNIAITAYMNYQWCHSPRTFGRLFYYSFDWCGYPFFVLDARTQRYKTDDRLADNHLLGKPTLDQSLHPSQLDQLLNWLSAAQQAKGDAPKFIVSSSVFVPNSMDERTAPGIDPDNLLSSDSWPAFPTTRRRLLQHIVTGKIQNVVFLSGDIHCSNVAQMSFDGAPDLRAFSITSSAFYWPFPFADGDPNGYVHDSTAPDQVDSFPLELPGANYRMNYKSWAFTQEDNFCRIDVDRQAATLTVGAYDKRGRLINVGPQTPAKLPLAAW
jgi:alkaline phosphatase D